MDFKIRQGLVAIVAITVGALQLCRADELRWRDGIVRLPSDREYNSPVNSTGATYPKRTLLVRLPPPLPLHEDGAAYEAIMPPTDEAPFDSLGFDPLETPAHGGMFHAMGDYFGVVLTDHANFYSRENLKLMGISFIVAAPLANTPIDGEMRDWYQQQIRTQGTDDFAKVAKIFGEQWIVVPAYFGAVALGKIAESIPVGDRLHQWGDCSIRSMLVGVPPLLFTQAAVGASRPDEDNSHWRPFNDNNGVSGHSFVGAIPFMNAAELSETPFMRTTFYALSVLPAWSRVNDDAHYLSQAMLGWWLAYLSVQSVHKTELSRSSFTLSPTYTPEGAGVMLDYRY